MEKLISALKSIPEYNMLLDCLRRGQSAAVTGIGQINRSHLIAGLRQDTDRPLVLLCQDDLAPVMVRRRRAPEAACHVRHAAVLPSLPSFPGYVGIDHLPQYPGRGRTAGL